MLSSVRSANRGNATASDIPPLSQSLSLEQITLGYQKYAHSGELKRILGVNFGISSDDHSFGVSHSKPIPPLPIKKLKMFQDSVQDTLGSARDRAIFWQRSICKLDGYEEAARSTKRQRINHFSSERFGQRNIMKMGDSNICHPHSNPPKKLEDKTMSSGLEMKKHLRTSMLDTQIDGRSAQVTRQLNIVEKCRGMLKVGDDIHIEEKIPRLLAGGGGWDRKRKRKRSSGAAGNRLITVEKNIKQAVRTKPSAETMLQPLQAQSCRSRASSRMVGIHNSVKSHLPTHLGSSTEPKIEIEGATHLRDSSTVTEEKIVPEEKNKADINVNRAVNHSTVTGKISRTPKTCSIPVLDSSSDFCNSSGADAGGEQGVNKIKATSLSVVNSKISPMSSTVNASKKSHLVVRRPLSILHRSRADFVPLAFNNDEVQILSQGLSSSGVGARPSGGAGVSLHVGRVDINSPNGKVEPDNLSSPPAFSDAEKSGGRENKPTGGEQGVNKIKATSLSVVNSKISPMSSTVNASKMSHLVVRRPLSILHRSRADFVPPAFNNDEVQILSQGLSSSGVGARPSGGAGVSLHVGRVDINSPNSKVEPDNLSSPPAFSDGEKSGGRENKPNVIVNDTGVAVDNASGKAVVSLSPPRKKKVLVKGRSGNNVEPRGQMFSAKLMVTPAMDKVENSPAKNPLQSVWCSSDKYRSKSGCPPSKKQMIRKSSIRSGKVVNSGFTGYTGELQDDREELLFAADFARNASYRACSSSFWKKMECYFTSVTSQDESYLKHQLDFADALGGSLHQIPGDENDDLDDLKLQEYPIYSGGRQESPADQESIETAALSRCSDMTKTFSEAPSLYQRVLSALIEDDERKEMSLQIEGRNDFQCASDDSHCGSCNYNDFEAENRDKMAFKDINCERKGRHMDHEVESEVDLQIRKQGLMDRNYCYKSVSSNNDSNRSVCSSICNNEHWQADDGLSYYAGHVPWRSQSDLGSSLESNASPISSPNCNYHMLSVEDKLRLELQSIDLCPEMHQRADGEEEINQDIIKLQAGLVQQAQKKKKCIRKIYESIQQGKGAEKRNLEEAAMSKLIEMAYKKQRASRGSHSSKIVLRRASKQVALRFAERTLARCREFEDTGRSCFSEAALQNIIFSTPTSNRDLNSVDKHASRSANRRYKTSANPNLQPKGSGSMDKQHYMGMNRELLPNDVGRESSRAMSGGIVKEKRSERAKDQTIKIISKKFVPHIGHPPVGSSVGVHESKLKPNVKESFLLASEDEPGGRYMEPAHAASDSPRVSSLSMAVVSDVARKKEELPNEEKNIVNPPAKLTKSVSFEHGDYTSLLDFDVDGLQDKDSQGLDIPMDDLSDVIMFM